MELFSVHLILRSQNLQVNIQIGNFLLTCFVYLQGLLLFNPHKFLVRRSLLPLLPTFQILLKREQIQFQQERVSLPFTFKPLKNPISIHIHAITILPGLFGAGDGSSKPKPAGTALFGKPQKPAASGIFGGSQSASNTGECIFYDRT